MTTKYSAKLTDGEVAWLLQTGRHTPQEGSPLLGFTGVPAGVDEASLRDRNLLENAWGVAFAVLAAPDRQVRVITPGPSETFIQVFYGSRSQPEAGLVGYWLEGDRLHVSFPWEEEDVAAVSAAVVLSSIPPPASAAQFSLGPNGVAALAGTIDVMRDRLFRSLTERRPVVDYRFGAAEVNGQLSAGADHDDGRWAVTLLRILAPQRLPLGQQLSDGELAELEAAGLVRSDSGSGSWIPEQALFALAGQWRHPLPAVAHEVIEGADGRIDRYDHRITIRGEGPLLTIDYTGMLTDQPRASFATVDVRAYLDALVDMMRPAEHLDREEWVYVLEPVDVRGLRDSSVVVATLQPGSWYRLDGEAGDWMRISDPNGPTEGWAPATRVHRRSESVLPTPEPEPTQVAKPAERVKPQPKASPLPPPVAAWSATHVAPPEGLHAWASPDPAGGVIANLPGGCELRVDDRKSDWAQVSAANGWRGWVDGRRLAAVATPHPPSPPVGSPTAATPEGQSRARVGRIPVIAAVALWLSALLPWWGEDGLDAADTSLFHVWDGSYDRPVWTIGRVMFLIGVAALVSVFWKPAVRHRITIAWIAISVAVAWLVATYAYLIVSQSEEWGTALSEMATTYFALGPWIALAAGIALVVRRQA